MQLLALLPLASLALAQSASSASSASGASASSTATGTAAVATQTVTVGQFGLRFTPETINVRTGGKVIFQFYPANHSVTQGDFNTPCQPSSNGINSAFVPVSNATNPQRTFSIDVTNSDPIFFYCGQGSHCRSGMVGVINPAANSQQQLSVYRNNAANSTLVSVPAQVRGGTLSGASTSTNGTTTNGTTTTSGGGSSTSSRAAGDAVKPSAGWIVALFAAIFATVVAA